MSCSGSAWLPGSHVLPGRRFMIPAGSGGAATFETSGGCVPRMAKQRHEKDAQKPNIIRHAHIHCSKVRLVTAVRAFGPGDPGAALIASLVFHGVHLPVRGGGNISRQGLFRPRVFPAGPAVHIHSGSGTRSGYRGKKKSEKNPDRMLKKGRAGRNRTPL